MLRGISTSWLNTMVSQQAFADDYLSNHLAERVLSPSIMIKHDHTSKKLPDNYFSNYPAMKILS